MLINTSGSSVYFIIFYSAAFFFAFVFLLLEGKKRNIPMSVWMLLLVFSTIFFIVGTKVFTYQMDDWLFMIRNGSLLPTSEKLLFGGIILGFVALLIGKYVLGTNQHIFDAYAVIFPLSIAIQRIGCFFNKSMKAVTESIASFLK
jgi:hypothetical protein